MDSMLPQPTTWWSCQRYQKVMGYALDMTLNASTKHECLTDEFQELPWIVKRSGLESSGKDKYPYIVIFSFWNCICLFPFFSWFAQIWGGVEGAGKNIDFLWDFITATFSTTTIVWWFRTLGAVGPTIKARWRVNKSKKTPQAEGLVELMDWFPARTEGVPSPHIVITDFNPIKGGCHRSSHLVIHN